MLFSRLGPVCLFGDFNAHTAKEDEAGAVEQQACGPMSMGTGPREQLPLRQNSDPRPLCAFGAELLRLCASTNCVILNGRAPGDREGAATYVRSSARGVSASVLDYGIVSRTLYPAVHHFTVLPPFSPRGGSWGQQPFSDHNVLLCVVEVPKPLLENL